MSTATVSEILFSEYCRLRGVHCAKIAESTGGARTPDFEVTTTYGPAIFEIKQIEPNEDDRNRDEQLQRGEITVRNRGRPGRRLLNIIDRAKGQLKGYSANGIPCVLGLYDTTGYWYLDVHQIEAAMFGELAAVISPDKPVLWTHGGSRKFTETRKRYISALAVINVNAESGEPYLVYYHNPFARTPFVHDAIPGEHDIHLFKQGHPDDVAYEWVCHSAG